VLNIYICNDDGNTQIKLYKTTNKGIYTASLSYTNKYINMLWFFNLHKFYFYYDIKQLCELILYTNV